MHVLPSNSTIYGWRSPDARQTSSQTGILALAKSRDLPHLHPWVKCPTDPPSPKNQTHPSQRPLSLADWMVHCRLHVDGSTAQLP